MKNHLLLALAALGFAGAACASGVMFGFENSDGHHYYRSSGLTSFEVRYSGDIEISPDQERVLSISPGGFLEIETRRLFTIREVRMTPGEKGGVEIRYWRADRRGSEEDGKAFLERHLSEVVRLTPVGARSEARRLLAAGGPRRVLSSLGDRDSDEAREIYLETILDGPPVDAPTGVEIIREAAREISGSSRLSRFLVRLAQKLPPDPELTARLARACDEISSSSARREALTGIANGRGIPAMAASDFAGSVAGISSSTEKAAAIERLAAGSTDPHVLSELAGAADTIDSSSERRRALSALVARPAIAGSPLIRVLKAAEGINSSSEKASFLAAAASACATPEAIRDYVHAADTIDSSSETRRALSALLRPELARDGWIAAVKAARRIGSSSEKASLLVRAAGAPSIDSAMLAAYLECAGSIDSSSEKRRAVVALLRRADLAPEQVTALTIFAEREISSSSEREAVLREAANRKS
ncbi:MAG: hypothetical protein ACRD16_04800 [Thermoanaerobaculia bacterium]